MSVMLEEQEIVINASRTNAMASMYVTDRTWMTKMDKKVKESPNLFKVKDVHRVQGEVIGKTYEFPSKLITIRSKERKVEMTEEQKKETGERLAKYRLQKK